MMIIQPTDPFFPNLHSNYLPTGFSSNFNSSYLCSKELIRQLQKETLDYHSYKDIIHALIIKLWQVDSYRHMSWRSRLKEIVVHQSKEIDYLLTNASSVVAHNDLDLFIIMDSWTWIDKSLFSRISGLCNLTDFENTSFFEKLDEKINIDKHDTLSYIFKMINMIMYETSIKLISKSLPARVWYDQTYVSKLWFTDEIDIPNEEALSKIDFATEFENNLSQWHAQYAWYIQCLLCIRHLAKFYEKNDNMQKYANNIQYRF